MIGLIKDTVCYWCGRKATHVVSVDGCASDACDDPACHEENPGRPLTPNQRRVVIRIECEKAGRGFPDY